MSIASGAVALSLELDVLSEGDQSARGDIGLDEGLHY